MENRPIFDSHLSEDLLEEYIFNRLPEDQCAKFEEHLLVCPLCQDHLTSAEQYTHLMKQATAKWHEAQPSKGSWPASRPRIIGAAVAVVAMAALAVTIPQSWRPARASAPVELVALRGGAGPGTARARAGSSIDIVIDATDLDGLHNLTIEVVDADGGPVWKSGLADPAGGTRISTRIVPQLRAGIYWIRLYSPQGELLREFGLRAE